MKPRYALTPEGPQQIVLGKLCNIHTGEAVEYADSVEIWAGETVAVLKDELRYVIIGTDGARRYPTPTRIGTKAEIWDPPFELGSELGNDPEPPTS